MSWTMPALLGAYHGLNPAMGWLFAVALGLQRREAGAVLRAIPPIALGHAVSVGVILLAVGAAGAVIPPAALRLGGAGVLFAFALHALLRRRAHPRWVGMRLGFRDLALWSFLMSSAHGAGLMLIPLFLGSAAPRAGMHAGHAPAAGGGLAVVAAHTAGMLVAMGGAALFAYRVLGVDFLRRAWVNLDAVWIGAMVVAGVVTLLPLSW